MILLHSLSAGLPVSRTRPGPRFAVRVPSPLPRTRFVLLGYRRWPVPPRDPDSAGPAGGREDTARLPAIGACKDAGSARAAPLLARRRPPVGRPGVPSPGTAGKRQHQEARAMARDT